MKNKSARRDFVKSLLIAPSVFSLDSMERMGNKMEQDNKKTKLKISLNAYSFNDPLRTKTMNLDDLIHFCAAHDFDGVDLTGYYFPGYPQVPSD